MVDGELCSHCGEHCACCRQEAKGDAFDWCEEAKMRKEETPYQEPDPNIVVHIE